MGRKEKLVSLESGDNLSIGQLMRYWRQSKAISLSDMARLLLYSRGYLSMIETGYKQPPPDLVNSYEEVLGLESGQLSQILHVQKPMLPAIEPLPFQNHLDLLNQGKELWNHWREKHPEISVSLDRVRLEGADLSGVNLSGADLTRAKLRRALLSNADLSGAILRQVDMSEATLNRANLSRSYLMGAKLLNANLSEANLSEANLSEANLSEANLSEANLSEANLSSTNLSGVDLGGGQLSRANLTGADLTGANLSRATIGRTTFGDNDLRNVKGLDTIMHIAPSSIGTDTLERSQGDVPDVFLRGAGLSDTFITYAHSLVSRPIEYYTCFISYSSNDDAFAQRLYADLQKYGVRCWFAPEDLKIGDKFWHRIDESIRFYDKMLIVLSQHSIMSTWVGKEVEAAFEKEHQEQRPILFPIRIDNSIMSTSLAWATDLRRMRHIGDFTEWKNHLFYQQAFRRLLRDLQASLIPVKSSFMPLQAKSAIFRWLEIQNKPELGDKLSQTSKLIFDQNGIKMRVKTKFYSDLRFLNNKIEEIYKTLMELQSENEKYLIVIAFSDESITQEASKLIALNIKAWPGISIAVGYLQQNEFHAISVLDTPNIGK